MAKLLFLSLVLFSQGASASFPTKAAGEIAGGLVEGFMGADDLKACMQKSFTELKDLEVVVKDFEEKKPDSAMKGLKELAVIYKGLPDALLKCKALDSDVNEIRDAFKQIHSPKSFVFHVGQNLVVNHNDIFHEIQTAVSDYHSKNWVGFGVEIGTALHKIVVGVSARFEEFEQKFNKTYATSEERKRRMDIFAHNVKQMKQLRRVEMGTAEYSHLTPYADLTKEEFAQRNGFKPALTQSSTSTVLQAELLSTSDLPTDFDWREKGAVNPVKDQKTCGSCWAFATVANIEGAGFVENKKLLSLSEQELVDCDMIDQGCSGGLPSNAYDDMIQNKLGLELESAYPYWATGGHPYQPKRWKCQATQSKEKAFIKSFVNISTDEDQIAAALMKYGPLAIGINAGPMQWYHGGVAHPWKILCNPKQLDHGVAIVGFGVDHGKKYWTIRNSWGAKWGEKGYYRIIRGTGACGLNTMVTSATGVTFGSADTEVIV